MNRLIRVFFAMLTMALLLISFASAAEENPFYIEHSGECRYSGAEYEVSQEAGIYESPEASAPVAFLAEGETVTPEVIWSNAWGYSGDAGGWLRLSDLARLYNEEDFLSEHGAALEEREGLYVIPDGASAVFWTFPGSGELAGSVSWEETDAGPSYSRVYTDENGEEWALAGYFHGVHGWLYLPDPTRDNLPRTAPPYASEPEAAQDPAEEQSSIVMPDRPLYFYASCAVLAAGVAAAFILYGKRKNGTGGAKSQITRNYYFGN